MVDVSCAKIADPTVKVKILNHRKVSLKGVG